MDLIDVDSIRQPKEVLRNYPKASLEHNDVANELRKSDPLTWTPIIVRGHTLVDGLLRLTIAKERGIKQIPYRKLSW